MKFLKVSNKEKVLKASFNTLYTKLSSKNSTFRKKKSFKNKRKIISLDKNREFIPTQPALFKWFLKIPRYKKNYTEQKFELTQRINSTDLHKYVYNIFFSWIYDFKDHWELLVATLTSNVLEVVIPAFTTYTHTHTHTHTHKTPGKTKSQNLFLYSSED